MLGAAFVFPTPTTADSQVEHKYISANLAGVTPVSDKYWEEDDLSILQQDDEDDAA